MAARNHRGPVVRPVYDAAWSLTATRLSVCGTLEHVTALRLLFWGAGFCHTQLLPRPGSVWAATAGSSAMPAQRHKLGAKNLQEDFGRTNLISSSICEWDAGADFTPVGVQRTAIAVRHPSGRSATFCPGCSGRILHARAHGCNGLRAVPTALKLGGQSGRIRALSDLIVKRKYEQSAL